MSLRIGRGGFTLVELLVVVAIMGIMVALLLPAVQSARESARRTQCVNNLKQLAMGCLSHESNQGHLPSGGWNWIWSGDPDRGYDRRQPGGWAYNVLPFIEQTSLRNLGAGKTGSAKRDDIATVGRSTVDTFFCPSRRSAAAYFNENNNVNASPISVAARADYAANAGLTHARGWWTSAPGNGGDPSFVDAPNYSWPNLSPGGPCDGVIYSLSTTRMAAITDGASNTYLVGEKYLNMDQYTTGKDPADNNILYGGFDYDNQRWSSTGVWRDRRGQSDSLSFGGPHAGGVQMAFCDGSVRNMTFDIVLSTHRNLCSRIDGQVVILDP